jgi:hypothetical protein
MVQNCLKIKNIPVYLLFFCLMTVSCSKFTKEPYDNRVQIESAEQYAKVLVNAYPVRHDMFTDILSDDYDYYGQLAQASNVSNYLPMFLWKDDYPDNIRTGPAVAYAGYYAKIYMANLAIEGIDAASGTDQQKKAVKGEALLIRAYCHFILVNLFGQHYNAATAGTNLGVPIVAAIMTGNINYYKRNTVKEVYDQVEKDATTGLALLKEGGSYIPVNPYHFSVASANAFLSRIKLYKGEWSESIRYSEAVIAEKGRIARKLSEDIPYKTSNGIPFFAARYMDPASHPNLLMLSYAVNFSAIVTTGYSLCGFFPSDSLTPMFNPVNQVTDLRRAVFTSVGTVIDARLIAIKYATQPNSPNNTPIKVPYFTMEEVLLNHAEAVLKTNSLSAIQTAIDDVETIRKERYVPYTPLDAGIGKEELLNIVMQERRKEFVNEGLRWFDVKRLGLKVEHRLSRGDAPADVLSVNDLRKAIQIPRLEQERNVPIASELNPR